MSHGDHGTGKHNSFFRILAKAFLKCTGREGHGIGPVNNDQMVFFCFDHALQTEVTFLISHVQAIEK